MAENSDCLHLIESIFKFIDQDPISCCREIIEKVTNILTVNDREVVEFSNSKSEIDISTAALLLHKFLQLYEKLMIEKSCVLTLKPILQIIKNYINCKNKNFDISFKDDSEFLEIVILTFRIAIIQKIPNDILDLAEFYSYNLQLINNTDDLKYNNEFTINFSLKILYNIYYVIGQCSHDEYIQSFIQAASAINKKNCIDEIKIFIKLIFYGNDNILLNTLLIILPNFTSCFKTQEGINKIWEEFFYLINSLKDDVPQTRLLLIPCYLFNLCFVDKAAMNDNRLMKLIFENKNYWKLIYSSLSKKNSIIKKQALYLLKNTVHLLLNSNENFYSYDHNFLESKHNSLTLVWWDSNFKYEISKVYEQMIILLEYFDEQQFHIIKPILKIMEEIVQKIICKLSDEKSINFLWVVLLFEQALTHDNVQIIKWGLDGLLKLPDNFYSDIFLQEKLITLLISTLNNIFIYYNNGMQLSENLVVFFKNYTKLQSSKTFFRSLITNMCALNWSPESLFYVIRALAQVPQHPSWENKEIVEISNFVTTAFKTHNKIIKIGIHNEFLNAIIALTDVKNVSLDNCLNLIMCFLNLNCLERNSELWMKLAFWIKNSYSEEMSAEYLENVFNKNFKVEKNEKFLALILVLFNDAYNYNMNLLYTESHNNFALNKLQLILKTFNNIDKRLYCDNFLIISFLKTISFILELTSKNNYIEKNVFLNFITPFFSDIIAYIFSQTFVLSKLQDYYTVSFLVEALNNILKTQNAYEINDIIVNKLNDIITVDIPLLEKEDESVPFMRIFCWMQFLKVAMERFTPKMIIKSKLKVFFDYLLKNINKPLSEKNFLLEKKCEKQGLWGKINSEYLECKWYLFNYLMEYLVNYTEYKNEIENILTVEILLNLSNDALNIGGYGILIPVMLVVKKIITKFNQFDDFSIIDLLWKLVMERRKSENFKILSQNFIELLFQPELIKNDSNIQDVLLKYTDLLFADSSLAVVNIFVKHIQKLDFNLSHNSLFSHMLAKSLMFGPIQRKDERLTAEVCNYIDELNIYNVREFNTSNEIRGRAIAIILSLDHTITEHKHFAWELIKKLINLEKEICKNKNRYFGDSLIHRVKHRVMQALLILEPVMFPNKTAADDLSKWLYDSLEAENAQPSVKYLQEWLLIRILTTYPHLLSDFWNHLDNYITLKTKGVCSLITISYHLGKIIPPDCVQNWLNQAIPKILPFTMDQHFEVRLYALVILEKYCLLAKDRKLFDIYDKYEIIHNSVQRSIQRGCKGNAGKNCTKLQEDFYLNIFNPFEHYSLKTIFKDLPRLANVGLDEWISSKVFKHCDAHKNNKIIPIENVCDSLEEVSCAKWSVSNKCNAQECLEPNEDIHNNLHSKINYQKKMIPLKELIPTLNDEFSDCTSRRVTDGLIVVASLIDRVPNLGGLARTCEIFGASEYVLGSLKYVEDKQFASLSVTAEKWITIKEVRPENLLNYLLNMKDEGFKVVGAEQALYSQPLNEVKFPKKSILLLGNEKEGIPPNLLPLLDICVEIPQVGIIRSLNVHVTGALFIWEYAKQNYFSS